MSTKYGDISYNLVKGLYTVLDDFVFREVDEITLTGTSGKVLITNNGVSAIATFNTSLTQTATDFVTANADDYLAAGTILTSSGAKLIFSANVPGTGFAGATTIVNIVYYLPSKDELSLMYSELKDHGVGDFSDNIYWSSSENDMISAYYVNYTNGSSDVNPKAIPNHVRACRSFTATEGAYSLRDTGPAGGLIFYASGTNYLESAESDLIDEAWSNVLNTLGTTGTAVGTGQANTAAIIGQTGHTNSAAKNCNDSSGDLSGTVVNADVTYPVYKSIPKTPASIYVYVGNVVNNTEGTKDEFHYTGTCQIQVVDESRQRGDKKLALEILSVIRGILKPTRASVFPISPSTLVVFEPGPYNEVITEADNNISKIKLIDIYNFLIT
jgi:hypothetical protein